MPKRSFALRPKFNAKNLGMPIPTGQNRPKPIKSDNDWLWLFSGGGTKGSFEAGVALYLQSVFEDNPKEIHGSSTGSLTAVKMAEGFEQGHRPATALVKLYRGLSLWSDMYVPSGAYNRLRAAVNEGRKAGLPLPSLPSAPGAEFGVSSVFDRVQRRNPAVEDIDPDPALDGLSPLGWRVATPVILPFAGVFLGIADALTGVVSSKIAAASEIEKALLDYEEEGSSIAKLTPLVTLLSESLDERLIGNSGVRLRLLTVRLSNGEPAWVTEQGDLIESDGSRNAIEAFPSPLQRGAIASASIPGFFPPVALRAAGKSDSFVDGGVRDIMPTGRVQDWIEERKRARRQPAVVAVSASPLENRLQGAQWAESQSGNVADILARAAEIAVDEVFRSEVSALREAMEDSGTPYVEIAPTFEVLSTVDVEPGLIDINIDYGYMRAFDSFWEDTFASTRPRELSDEITLLRRRAWALERRHLRCRRVRHNAFSTREPAIGMLPADAPLPPRGVTYENLNAFGISPSIVYSNSAWAKRRYADIRGRAHRLFQLKSDSEGFLVFLNQAAEDAWTGDGRPVDDIVVWEHGVIERLRDIKREIGEKLVERRRTFGQSSLPPGTSDWTARFERHVTLRVFDPPATESRIGLGDFSNYTPWSQHIETSGRIIPAVDTV